MTNNNKRGLGLKRRLQEANDEERAVLRDGLPYDVGFAKPPAHGKFKNGKSGNARGRPKGSENLGKVAVEEFSEMVEIHEHGKRRKLPKQRVAMRQLANKAATGDPKAIALLLEIQKKTGQLDARDLETFSRFLDYFNPQEAVEQEHDGGEQS
jgi:Family of unknown function (DUF5681)